MVATTGIATLVTPESSPSLIPISDPASILLQMHIHSMQILCPFSYNVLLFIDSIKYSRVPDIFTLLPNFELHSSAMS